MHGAEAQNRPVETSTVVHVVMVDPVPIYAKGIVSGCVVLLNGVAKNGKGMRTC
jgi:hypothetical protein